MSAPPLSFDAIRNCEAEIWRALFATLQTMRAHWTGSYVARKALERVSAVIDEQVKRTDTMKGGSGWAQ